MQADLALTPIHLCIVQPVGYVHSLGLLDPARYLRWQFRRLGAEVTLAKNRLREDAVNFVFGAHLGFDPQALQRHACIVVNLEQLGPGGAQLSADYLALLRRAAVVDYEAANVAFYGQNPDDVPLIEFGHAPYLAPAQPLPLHQRPIDLLFFGSLNPRRRAFLQRVEACGVSVAQFDHPLYGEERDHFIGQAKAVLNCHFYDSSRFEQVRAFHSLSLGTPVVAERSARTTPPAAFEDAVFWLGDGPGAQPLEAFFRQQFGQPAWYAQAQQRLDALAHHDPLGQYADLLAFAGGFGQAHAQARPRTPWTPRCINLGSGKDYKPGWLNIDILERAQPDLVLDLGQPLRLPLHTVGPLGAEVRLEPASVDLVYANNVLEHVPDLPRLMGNVLALLKEGGEFHIEVPYEHAPTAWQDPTHLRALNEASWRYYTEWFWYLGWFEHRFDIAQFEWLDLQLKACAREQAAFMKLRLKKQATSPRERTVARTLQADFGGLPDDWPSRPEACAISGDPASPDLVPQAPGLDCQPTP